MPFGYFVVHALDCTDSDVNARRIAAQEEHLTAMMRNPALRVGGGILSPLECLDTPQAEKKLIGSLMIMKADTYADVKKMIESDVYWTNNVWDNEKLQIFPWVSPTTLEPPPTPTPTPLSEPTKESADESADDSTDESADESAEA